MSTQNPIKTKKFRPALKEMGFWKWPSILLVVFSLGMIVLYFEYAAGSHPIIGREQSGLIAGCDYRIGFIRSEAGVEVTAQVAPKCSKIIARPHVELRLMNGDILSHAELRGGQNQLRTTLQIPENNMPKLYTVALVTNNLGAETHEITWKSTDLGL